MLTRAKRSVFHTCCCFASLPPLLVALAIAFGAWEAAAGEYRAWVLAQLSDTPEGLALDADGNLIASLLHSCEIVRISRAGEVEHIAWVPSKAEQGRGSLIGLDLDASGNIFVTYTQHSPRYEETNLIDPFHAACRDATVTMSGLYKVDPQTGTVTAVATRADGWAFCFPDDVDIDSDGTIYMTDLTYSGIWKISPDGSEVELWAASPLLSWSSTPYSGLPLGVNVLVLDAGQENIYAGTDGEPMVLKIPIQEDGTSGAPIILSSGHSVLDGIELDEDGNIYVSEILRNEISVIAADGSRRFVIADARTAPLDNNTSLVYRNGVLCTANLGFTHESPEQADRTIVCIEGFDRP